MPARMNGSYPENISRSFSLFVALCNAFAVHDGEDEFGQLVDLLTGELEKAVAATLATHSPGPARDFAGQVARADLAATPEGTGGENDVLGLSVVFFVVACWITALHRGAFGGSPVLTAVDWAGRHLGAECAAQARRVAGAISPAGEGHEVSGIEFVPALVWLAAGLAAEYGEGDPGWLSRHTETVAAFHAGSLPPAPRRPSW
jgi:hypothetical protein